MPDAVLFDLDNTLYDEREYVFAVLELFCSEHGLESGQARTAYIAELESGSSDILGGILKRVGFYTPVLQEELFQCYQSAAVTVQLYGDAVSTLAELRNKGIKTGILTNGVSQAQRNKVRCLGVDRLVDEVIYARDFGAAREKPHNSGYRALLNVLDVRAEDAIFVGDSLHTDIKGANRMNITAVLIQRPELRSCTFNERTGNTGAPDNAVRDLDEFLSIMGLN